MFIIPPTITYIRLVSLSDAFHGCGGDIYGQIGTLSGMVAHCASRDNRIFHPIV